jgi:signal transduction histidine kinase
LTTDQALAADAAPKTRTASRLFGRAAPRAARRPSLVRRLIWLALVWSLLVLLGAGIALTAFFQRSSLNRFDLGLFEINEGLYAGTTVEGGEIVAPALTDSRATRAYSGRYWEIAQPGGPEGMQLLVPSRSLWDSEMKPPPQVLKQGPAAFKPGETIYYDTVGPAGERLRAAARTVTLPNWPRPVIFIAAENRGPIDSDARRFALTTAIALLLLGAGLVGGVILQVRVGLQPLFRLRREVADVRKGKAEALAADYPVELAPLAMELNALLAHNHEVVERQRTHVGNLAHALKTPLSVMLSEAELRPGDPLSEVVTRQAQTMREQVDHHLRRARAAARAQGSGERTEVAPVLDELARTLERIFGERGVRIDWDADDALSFRGERQDLLEVAGNAMENACKWCHRRVKAYAESASPGLLRLIVEDDGPGLPPERREEVLRRGARLDESAPGSGLGLSIIDDLAKAYGGSVSLGESGLGGLKVEVLLPKAEG